MSSLISRIGEELRSPELAEKIKKIFEKAGIPWDLNPIDLDTNRFEAIANSMIEELDPSEGRLVYGKLLEKLRECGSRLPEILEEKVFPEKLPPEKRKGSFGEIVLHIDPEEAAEEAKRCLRCRNPKCVEACPLHFPVPAFLKLTAEKRFDSACRIFLSLIPTPATCGRICIGYCEKACTLNQLAGKPVKIRNVKRAISEVTDVSENLPKSRPHTGLKIAVVGSGPAGLTAAYHLRLLGHYVTVFEASDRIGGMLIDAIPEFRLPSRVVEEEVELLRILGIEFKPKTLIGRDLMIDDLFNQGYHAIFIATGGGEPLVPKIPGLELKGVHMALDLLRKVKRGEHVDIFGKVWVIGGGNVAMDVARTALRLGVEEVKIMYRRSRREMPADEKEINATLEEGIEIVFLTQPIELIGERGRLKKIKCIKMRLGEPGPDGRRVPIPIPGSEFEVDADHVIFAIGGRPSTKWIREEDGIELTERGLIKVDEKLATSRPGVFAGGDVVRGLSTYTIATADGIKAAREIDSYLRTQRYSKTTIT